MLTRGDTQDRYKAEGKEQRRPIHRFKIIRMASAEVGIAVRFNGTDSGLQEFPITLTAEHAVNDEVYATMPEGGTPLTDPEHSGKPVLWRELGAGGKGAVMGALVSALAMGGAYAGKVLAGGDANINSSVAGDLSAPITTGGADVTVLNALEEGSNGHLVADFATERPFFIGAYTGQLDTAFTPNRPVVLAFAIGFPDVPEKVLSRRGARMLVWQYIGTHG